MPAALATFRYPAAWSATLAWALSPLGLSSTVRQRSGGEFADPPGGEVSVDLAGKHPAGFGGLRVDFIGQGRRNWQESLGAAFSLDGKAAPALRRAFQSLGYVVGRFP